MMFKKMKKSPPDSAAHDDAKILFKYQTLMQDYQELHKEVEETRNRLENVKQKKLVLLTEVRFLRQRYKYLMTNKPAYHPSQEREISQPLKLETQRKKNMKYQINGKRAATYHPSYPSNDLNKKKRGVCAGGEAAPRKAAPLFDLNHVEASNGGRLAGTQKQNQFSDFSSRGGKEASIRNPTSVPAIDLNQSIRKYGGNNAASQITDPPLDLNRKDRARYGNEAPSQSRAPIFDLNEISGEEEDFQNSSKSINLEESKKGLGRDDADEQLHDLKLPICRNVGDGSTRIGKRKISWQDPVALRV